MNNFTFYTPTYFVFGKDTENSAGEYVKKFGGSKVLIHYGGGSVVRSGLLDRVKASLDREGIDYVELGGVEPNPKSDLVYKGIELCRKESVDFILPVGGGSTIDSAKAIAIGVPYDGDFWDFFKGTAVIEALPVGTVLTLAATGSEGSMDSVVTHGTYKRGISTDLIRPKFSILNPELTMSLPPYQTASGITDIMAHVMERYFTHTKEVEITDRLAEGILLTMLKEGKRVMEEPDNYDARANIMWAGMVAHDDSVGVGRDQDWGSHHMEHELSTLYNCSHGAGLAIMLPAWMGYVMHLDVNRFAQFAVRVFGCEMNFAHPEETAKEGIARFKDFVKSIGMPTTISEIGGKEEDFAVMAQTMFHENPNHGGFLKLSEKIVVEIYGLAL